MKRILLPTDFSENSYNAIKYALQLLKNDVCEFHLLHTYTPAIVSAGSMLDSYSIITIQQIAQDNAQKNIDTLKERMLKDFHNENHSFTAITSFNMLIAEMCNIIEEHDIDFVVMGTQGATGAKEIFIGTHTMFALKKISCPLIAVPANFNYEAPKEILFPTDYKLDHNNKYLSLLRDICNTHVSRLHILNAYYGNPFTTAQENTQSFLDTYFKNNAHLFHIAEGTDIMGAVEKFQEKTMINFMVMIHNKHHFFENMLFKPVINQVVYHTNVPFLVIPCAARQ
jgi:nucleotide-binding universal stress UspA family protein